jgi:putative transcriptional regulator
MSCVLSGGFSHDGGHFGPGDFDIGDETSVHRVAVDAGEDCIALIVLDGKLRLTGRFWRLLAPFLRL